MQCIVGKGWVKDVYHKITLPGRSSHYSAWFDDCGFMVDCERFDKLGRTFPCNFNEREDLKRGGWSAKQHYTFNPNA